MNETKETRTELPVDQREAEEVEEVQSCCLVTRGQSSPTLDLSTKSHFLTSCPFKMPFGKSICCYMEFIAISKKKLFLR